MDGPTVYQLKITYENICDELNSGRYSSGIDPETMADMLCQLYRYTTNVLNGKPLKLPAPMNDLEDKYNILWPEGTRVKTRSRRDSFASEGSSKTPNGARVPNMRSQYGSSVASSTRSSRYAPVKARFMDEDDLDDGVRSLKLADIKRSQPQRTNSNNVQASSSRRPERVMEDDGEEEMQRFNTRRSSASQRRREVEQPLQRRGKKPVEFLDD